MARLMGGRAATEAEWQAMAARQATAGVVYAVASTGIHCRTGCPARMPLLKNLRLFETAEAAEVAGYRACKRCGGGIRIPSHSQG